MNSFTYGWKALYPFKGNRLDLGGYSMHYVDEGQGDPIVMVHGNPSWSFYYRNLIAEFKKDHRCIAMDHIGMGLSDKPGDERYRYIFENRVADLETLLEHLGIRKNITLVVHDWGGAIGMAYACRHPERVARLIVLNTAAFFPPAGKHLPTSLSMARSSLGALLVQGFNLFSWGALRFGCVKPISKAAWQGMLAPYDSWDHRRAVLRFVQDIPRHAGDPSYELVRWMGENLEKLRGKPMLIAWGMKDFVFDVDILSEWRRRFPEAEVHEFPDAGHYVLEDVGTEIIALSRRFLACSPKI